MSREKELVKNILVLGLGKMLPKLTAFVTLPILTAKLTKIEYGTYDLISTLIMLVIPIATLQIQSAAFRFLIDCRGNKKSTASIITNIFAVTVPITVLVSLLIQFFFIDFSIIIRGLISIYFFIDTFYLTCGQIVRGIGKNKEYSIAAIAVSVINMLCVFLLVQIKEQGILGVFIALILANIVGSIYLSIVAQIQNYINHSFFSLVKIRELLSYSWPMIPNNLSTWVLKLSDRIVITFFLGVEANAVYAVANKVPNLLSMAQSVMVMAWHENASTVVNDNDADKYYSYMQEKMFKLMFSCTALLISMTPIIFNILIKGEYSEAYCQMPILILAMFFYVMSSFFGGIYIAHKKTKNVGISTIIAAIINFVIDICLVNLIGIWAGSVSTLIAYMTLYYYRMFNCQKFQKLEINLFKQIIMIGVLTVMLVMCFMQEMFLNIINLILGMVIFIVFNWEFIKKLFYKLK